MNGKTVVTALEHRADSLKLARFLFLKPSLGHSLHMCTEQGFSFKENPHTVLNDSMGPFIEWESNPGPGGQAILDFKPTQVPHSK